MKILKCDICGSEKEVSSRRLPVYYRSDIGAGRIRMKAPDKIYVEVCEDGIFAFEKPPFKESIEYVRKDALFEWAKETYLNENASAIRKVCYKQFIDKLNLMLKED